MLKCLIAFILGWLISRQMGNGFSIGCINLNNENIIEETISYMNKYPTKFAELVKIETEIMKSLPSKKDIYEYIISKTNIKLEDLTHIANQLRSSKEYQRLLEIIKKQDSIETFVVSCSVESWFKKQGKDIDHWTDKHKDALEVTGGVIAGGLAVGCVIATAGVCAVAEAGVVEGGLVGEAAVATGETMEVGGTLYNVGVDSSTGGRVLLNSAGKIVAHI